MQGRKLLFDVEILYKKSEALPKVLPISNVKFLQEGFYLDPSFGLLKK